MRLSRPCYDKPHRCPGWAGGGTRSARAYLCDDGRLRRDGSMEGIYGGRFWQWRFNRCDTCDVLTLPYVVRLVDWRYWWSWKILNPIQLRLLARRWRREHRR